MDYIAQFKKKITLILLSAGDSTRFSKSNLPKKQWLRIGDKPLWRHLVDVFSNNGFENILVVCSPKEARFAKNFYPHILEGGSTRTKSIQNALAQVKTDYVLVHDVARFNPQISVIDQLLRQALADSSACCVAPKIPLVDTLYHQEGFYLKREEIFAIQTPQLSKTDILKIAFSQGEFSDESSAIRALKEKVCLISGSPLMLKLTNPCDLTFFNLPKPSQEIFVGGGIDMHRYEKGKQMVLCGVKIESDVGFEAHSDGDVAIHSIIDALLGAVGAGDIGEWFPDTDLQYHNVDSKNLLKEVVDFIVGVGYEMINIDLSILAQLPKIAPYKDKMRHQLSSLLNIPYSRVNIKATTAERMGFVGREEGLCVMSQINLKFVDWSLK